MNTAAVIVLSPSLYVITTSSEQLFQCSIVELHGISAAEACPDDIKSLPRIFAVSVAPDRPQKSVRKSEIH